MEYCAYMFQLAGLIISGYGTRNIALNKPASQSSAWSASYSTASGNVVDGNLDRDINNGHCTATTGGDLTPWWMVDLGKPYTIHNITIVNRGDWKEDYLHDFYIEVFRVHPLTWSETTAQQCMYYNGILLDVETLTCDVPTIGRYVRIRKIPRADKTNLFLCEVEIRGTALEKQECGNMNLPVHKGKRLQTGNISTVTSLSISDCAAVCKNISDCYDVNYNSMAQTCELVMIRSFTDVMVVDEDWRFTSFP